MSRTKYISEYAEVVAMNDVARRMAMKLTIRFQSGYGWLNERPQQLIWLRP